MSKFISVWKVSETWFFVVFAMNETHFTIVEFLYPYGSSLNGYRAEGKAIAKLQGLEFRRLRTVDRQQRKKKFCSYYELQQQL